ncbi:hypothetical protein M2271_006186 [Streptomyces sp. LBL]|nr:hypothetical protein [Streptomyces sp. LBL]
MVGSTASGEARGTGPRRLNVSSLKEAIDIADQIYGYSVAGDEPVVTPVVTWDREIMTSDRWKREVRDVRSVVDRAFPG